MRYQILYKNCEKIWGPLLAVRGVSDIPFGVFVRITMPDGRKKQGKVLQLENDLALIQVFEGTKDLNAKDTRIRFDYEPFRIPVSAGMKGRIFDPYCRPRDGLGEIISDETRDINGVPINPVRRAYPRDYIETGISAVDSLITLIRGQKLPIFSGSGLPHNEIALEIAKNAKIKDSSGNFIVIFAAMGIKNDDAMKYYASFEKEGKLDNVVLFFNLADDPPMERLIIPRTALTVAEYFAFELGYEVLVILSDMTNYCEALREISSARSEVPSRKGYPGYLYSDLASIYERAGRIKGVKGSISQIPILTMPNDDITHPVPDMTGYITEGQIVLSRELNIAGVFPPIDILTSLSRLMKDGIGEKYTTPEHPHLAAQVYASYAHAKNIRMIANVIGEEELSETDRAYLRFAASLEKEFIHQGTEGRTIDVTLMKAWEMLRILPRKELNKFTDKELEENYGGSR